MIRPVHPNDAERVAAIYNHYIRSSIITFEERDVSSSEMAGRCADINAANLPWLVLENGKDIAGYACAGPWKTRSAYRFSVESSVYIDPVATGQGFGSALYAALLPLLRERSLHAVMGGIALPNPASVALHQKFGFRKVAHLREVGFKFERWIDVGYWQLVL